MRLEPFDKLILRGGTVHALDDRDTLADAVGFAGGRVTAVGSLDAVREATPGADERDLDGKHAYPGFIDAHHHLCFAATYAGFPEVRTRPGATVDDLCRAVAAAAERTAPGEWIVLLGYNDVDLAEGRKPTRFDLDPVSPRHPLLLVHFTYHEGVLNSLGLEQSGLAAVASDPPGGQMGRTRRGNLDGRVFERCFGQAEAAARGALVARDRESWFARANRYQERLLAAGITHVCDAAVPPSMEELYREWSRRAELHVGVTMMPLVENMFEAPRARLASRTTATGWNDGRLSVGALKLFADGGVSCAMCLPLRAAVLQLGAMLGRLLRQRSLLPWRLAAQQPARWGADGKLHTGLLYYDRDALGAVVRAAAEQGFGVGIHAGGNEAIAIAIDALEREHRGPLPARIDHFFFAEEASVRRTVERDIHVVVQPIQLYDTGPMLEKTGVPPGLTYQAHRSMLGAGAVLAGSSDAPVFSFDVLAAIETAARRKTASGAVLGAGEALAAADALRLYTRGAAKALGMEGEIGELRRGARADAVVLSEEIERVPAERLSDVGVLSTFAGRRALVP